MAYKAFLKKLLLPLINGGIFLLLFWLVTTFIYLDTARLAYWSAGGFSLGIVQGFILQWLLPSRRSLSLSLILLAEFALGFWFVGPYAWLHLRFNLPSNLHSICCETPKDYGAAQYETLHITTPDGALISGWYVAPSTQIGKVIILIHGYGYDRRGTDFQTRILLTAGYGVLLYDLRGHGESTGRLNSFNRMQAYQSDLQLVLKFLRDKPEVTQISAVGISLGAFAILNSTPETLNSFSGLWLDGLRFENFGAEVEVQSPLDFFRRSFDHQSRWLASQIYNEPVPPPNTRFTQIIPTIQKPKVMLVASGLDESERSTNEKLIPVLDANKELWIIPNAWHIGGRFDAPDEYRQKILRFFDEAFKKVE